MTTVHKSLILAAALLAPGFGVAQSPPREVRPPALQRAEPRKLTRMYEDIEILRRLLNRQLATVQAGKCTNCHANPFADMDKDGKTDLLIANATGQPGGLNLNDTTFDLLVQHSLQGKGLDALTDGVYLPGTGVIYQVVLPAEWQHFHAMPAPAKAKEISDWDKIRKELQGEKVAVPSAEPHTFRLEDALLRVLADNGHHFSQLEPTETITIAITFRGPAPASSGKPNQPGGMRGPSMGSAGGGGAMMPGLGGGPVAPGMPNPSGGPGLFNKGASGGGGAPSGLGQGMMGPGQTNDAELLGDFYLRTGKLSAATFYYEKALVKYPERKAALYRKLAQACLKEMNSADAVAKAIEFLKKAQDIKTAKTAPVKSTLPTRLLISIEKRVLDMSAEGKTTFEAFRKRARVEWLRFPLAETKQAALELPAAAPNLIRVKGGRFQIPIRFDEDRRQELAEVRLLTSHNRGQSWKVIKTVPPTVDAIPLNTIKSGELWLSVQVVRKDGRLDPPDVTTMQPVLKLFVEGRD
jgi:hypothetical protein